MPVLLEDLAQQVRKLRGRQDDHDQGGRNSLWLYNTGTLKPDPAGTSPLLSFEVDAADMTFNTLDTFTVTAAKPFLNGGAQLIQNYTLTQDATIHGTEYNVGVDELIGSPLAVKYDVEITQAVGDRYPEWDSGTTYAEGDFVYYTPNLKAYISLQDSNTGHTPPGSIDAWWFNDITGAVSFNSFTNPWITETGTYGQNPEGPRAMFSLEGTSQWNQASGLSGSAVPIFNIWYTYKNKSGVDRELGSNALTQLTYMALADDESIGVAQIPDVTAPNIRSEDTRSTFRGYWGWLSNPFHGTIGTGNLSATGAESVGFMSLPMFMGDTQWGTVYDLWVREAWMSAGLGTQTGDTPTLDTRVGIWIDPLTAAATNLAMVLNNSVLVMDKDRTYTSSPWDAGSPFTGGSWLSVENKFTLNYSNATLGSFINWSPTVEVQQTAASFGTVAVFVAGGTYQNISGAVSHLGNVTAFYNAPTITAARANTNGGSHHTVQSQPVFSRTGSGTFTGFTTWTDLESDLTVTANAHVEERKGYTFNDANTGALGSGRLSTQYGIWIDQLFGADTSVGIYNASTTVFDAYANPITGVGSTIDPIGTTVYLDNSSGAPRTLTSTPTIPAGAEGQILTVVNVSTNAVTLQDSATLTGSLLKLRAATRQLTQYSSISFIYNTFFGGWIETNFSNSAGILYPTAIISDVLPGGGMFWMQDFGSNNVALQLFKTRGDANAMVSLATGNGLTTGLYFGPGGASALDVSLVRSGTAAATFTGTLTTGALNIFQLGAATQPSGGEFKLEDNGSNNLTLKFYKVAGETQPVAQFGMILGATAPGMYLGPGGSTVYDVSLTRTGTAALGITGATTVTGALTVSSTLTAQALLAWTRTGSLTASQTFAQLTSSWTYATTASMINTFLNYAPTQTWTVAPLAGVMDIVYQNAATYINGSAATINFSGVWSFLAGYIKTIDTQTGRNVGANLDYQATPTYNVANSGTFTAGSWKGFTASPTINGTGCTMSAWTNFESGGTVTLGTITAATAFNATGYAVAGTVTTLTGIKFADATGAGTVTNQIAVDVPAMTKGGTLNIGIRNAPAVVWTPTTITVTTNTATIPVSCRHAKLTNSSAAAMTVTLTTTNAQDGQELLVKIYDATAATQTVTFTNSETGGAGAPPATFGSTTIATTYRFIFNSTSSKWTYCSR